MRRAEAQAHSDKQVRLPPPRAEVLGAGGLPWRVFAFNKPKGLTIEQGSAPTAGAGGRRWTLNDWIVKFEALHGGPPDLVAHDIGAGVRRRLSAVGRLDKETSGLLLFTDDGVLNEAVLWPGTVRKVYEAVVKLREPARPTSDQLRRLTDGVELTDGLARAESVEVIDEWTQSAPTERLSTGKVTTLAARGRLQLVAICACWADYHTKDLTAPHTLYVGTQTCTDR